MAQEKVIQSNNKSSSGLQRLLKTKEMGVLGALVVLTVLMSFLNQYFATTQNIFNLMAAFFTIGIMAIGMTMIIVTGGIDLSVGSILAAGAMATARLMTYGGLNPWLSVLGGLLMGTIFGAVNGLIITKVKVYPFITTLGMMSIARGVAYLLATGLQGTRRQQYPDERSGRQFSGCRRTWKYPIPLPCD